MADVFISYKREDRRHAEQLSNALKRHGFSVWWDFELLSGQRYRAAIAKVIDECKAAIVIWSDRATRSDFVVDEAQYANQQQKLCPVRVEDCKLPFGFGQMHTNNLSAWDGAFDFPNFQALLRALESKTGKAAQLGGTASTPADLGAAVELEAFKVAQLASNVSALRAFLKSHPNGNFANFVHGQIASMEEDAVEQRNAAGHAFPEAPTTPEQRGAQIQRAPNGGFLRRKSRPLLGALIGYVNVGIALPAWLSPTNDSSWLMPPGIVLGIVALALASLSLYFVAVRNWSLAGALLSALVFPFAFLRAGVGITEILPQTAMGGPVFGTVVVCTMVFAAPGTGLLIAVAENWVRRHSGRHESMPRTKS